MIRRLVLGVFCLLLLGTGSFVFWAQQASPPMDTALAALRSDSTVTVITAPWLTFRPAQDASAVGLIFYPGARVDPRAYAPAARTLAANGTVTVIVPMPLHLAIFGAEQATAVMAAFPEVTRWVIGGHSLGGAMAARYAARHPQAVAGLLLWAAYPATDDDLAAQELTVTSVYGTRDGLATVAKIDGSRPLLPPRSTYVAIEGGNHAQFGWYGPQSGDHPATIDRESQQAQIVAATRALLQGLE